MCFFEFFYFSFSSRVKRYLSAENSPCHRRWPSSS